MEAKPTLLGWAKTARLTLKRQRRLVIEVAQNKVAGAISPIGFPCDDAILSKECLA
jgi:hypothetical protein